jgi:RNA polymerase sigma factor for flagellar operon FliA
MLQSATNVKTSYPLPVGGELSDAARQEALVNEMLPEVKRIARSIHERLPQSISIEDLSQAGVLGLLDAAKKYKPSKNVPFKVYARVRVRGAIIDSLRQDDWGPRSLRSQARRIHEASAQLQSRLGREPEETEIAEEIGVSLEKYQKLISEIRGLSVSSMFCGYNSMDEPEMEIQVPCSPEEDPFHQCSRSELRGIVATALGTLSEKERRVIALYYYEERNMRDIGTSVGVVESRVSQLHSQALEKLRTRLSSDLTK